MVTFEKEFEDVSILVEGKLATASLRIEAQIDIEFDPNYGADADGNRGMPMTFINSNILEPINAYLYNEDGEVSKTPIKIKWEDISPETRREIESTADEFGYEQSSDGPEPDDYE